jgi:hypothetical protein
MEYRVEKTLPPNMISRLIVRRHEDIGHENVMWNKGAILHYSRDKIEGEGEATAYIMESANERVITVWVQGEARTLLLNSLRMELNSIFSDYRRLNHTLSYEIIFPDNMSISPHNKATMEKDEVIINHLNVGRDLLIGDADINLDDTEREYALEDPLRNSNAEIRELKKRVSELKERITELQEEPEVMAKIGEILQLLEREMRTSAPSQIVVETLSDKLKEILLRSAITGATKVALSELVKSLSDAFF